MDAPDHQPARRFHTIIVAGGRGERAGGDLPKQYAMLAGRPVLHWSAAVFANHPDCAGLTIVHADAPGQRELAAASLGTIAAALVPGGVTRQASVAAGLATLDRGCDLVLVHDAARPGVDPAIIDRLLAALSDDAVAGAVPVLSMVDTVAQHANGALGATQDRDTLARIQTPQAFRRVDLLAAHAASGDGAASDDAQMVRSAGGRIAIVEGSERLGKITHAEDFAIIGAMLGSGLPAWRMASGIGYDVHALVAGDIIWLGGVAIAHDRQLSGHSDADVLLHAVTDAILGALGDGDIGSHFPPNDPQWRGAASHRFLRHACDRVSASGGHIEHIDCILICENPRIGPHRDAIRARIAEICAIATDQVSVKATTTERLGFTGREEGIAAQAIATLILPRREGA